MIFHEPRSSLGTASVGSVAFDGNMIEASVHWLDRRPEPAPPDQLTVFSCRVAAGIVFATNLADFQETHRVFANFLDWLRDVRKLRFDRLKKMSYVDPDPPPAVEVAAHEPEPILEPGIEKAKGKKRKQAPEEKGSEAEGGKVKAAGTKARRTRLWDK